MEVTSNYQTEVFLYSCIFGSILGLYYDFFKIISMLIGKEKIKIFFLDLIYMAISGFFTFIFLLAVNYGNLRFYILAGEAMGWCIYHITLGSFVMYFANALIKFFNILISFIKSHILIPAVCFVKKLFRLIFNPFYILVNKIIKSNLIKKFFIKKT